VDAFVVQLAFASGWTELVADFFSPDGIFGGAYPPLYFIAAKAFGTLAGTGLVALRAFSVFTLALLVVVSWFGTDVLVNEPRTRDRFWFSLAVGTSPAHIWWAQTARYVMFLYLIYAIALLVAIAFVRRRELWLAVAVGVTTSAVIYTHYVGFYFAAAQFLVLGLVVTWRKDKVLLRRSLVAAGVAAILVVPILPTFLEAMAVMDEEGYSAGYERPIGPNDLVRGYLVDWNFGHGLIPEGRGLTSVEQALNRTAAGDWGDALLSLRRVILPLAAVLVVLTSLGVVASGLYRDPALRWVPLYLVAVGTLAFGFGLLRGMASRFVYFGYGTWCTLAILTVGFSSARARKLVVSLQVAILLLYAASLISYYSNLDRKYPGTRAIAEFLQEQQASIHHVIIDHWIWNVRSGSHDRVPLPSGFQLAVVPSVADLQRNLPRESSFAFFGGLREEVEEELQKAMGGIPGWSWQHARSWESLETPERSIHAYYLTRAVETQAQ
jgi:4-amino-4-deoxy-L-arabinose transferase-like glycosyltransferase